MSDTMKLLAAKKAEIKAAKDTEVLLAEMKLKRETEAFAEFHKMFSEVWPHVGTTWVKAERLTPTHAMFYQNGNWGRRFYVEENGGSVGYYTSFSGGDVKRFENAERFRDAILTFLADCVTIPE